MKHTTNSTHRIAFLSLCISLCLILGYVESLLSFIPVPGIKLGLPNLVILFLLYKSSFKDAFTVNLLRIVLNSILFGNIYSFLFSLCGGLLSLILMSILYKQEYHIYTISIVGGMSHNIGQIIIASLLTSVQIFYYLPILLCSGILCGFFNSLVAKRLLVHLKPILKK